MELIPFGAFLVSCDSKSTTTKEEQDIKFHLVGILVHRRTNSFEASRHVGESYSHSRSILIIRWYQSRFVFKEKKVKKKNGTWPSFSCLVIYLVRSNSYGTFRQKNERPAT